MIDIVISENCTHCKEQLEVMRKSFFEDEYRVVKLNTPEFEKLNFNGEIEGVPFVIIRDQNGNAKYAKTGVHDGTELHKLERKTPEPFNFSKLKLVKI